MWDVIRWLLTPLRALFKPWWDSKVENKAGELAIKLKVVEAIVGFRTHDFVQSQSQAGNDDREIGLARRVVDRLKPDLLAHPETDVANELFLRRIESEIMIHGIDSTPWAELSCLTAAKEFNPNAYIAVEFSNKGGGTSHGSTFIASLQSSFPFLKPLTFASPASAAVSADGIALIREYRSRNSVAEIRYTIDQTMPLPMASLANFQVLAKDWKPAA